MPTPSTPPNKSFDPTGAGTYTHPLTAEQFTAVTTALESFNKAALIQWAANLAAAQAADLVPQIVASTLIQECGKQHTKERCDRCTPCLIRRASLRHYYEKQRRAKEGTDTHNAIDGWIGGGALRAHTPESAPYVEQFRLFCERFGLRRENFEAGSTTVLNRAWRYGGTLDHMARYERGPAATNELLARLGQPEALIMVDCKTREKPDARMFSDTALQLAAYRRAETIMRRDGQEIALPRVDATAVLQLRPGGHTLRLTVSDDAAFEAFLAALALHRWDKNHGTASTAESSFPLLASPVAATAAPKKATPATRKPPPGGAIMASARRAPAELLPASAVHPDSPYNDDIPF